MKEALLHAFQQYPQAALLISLLLSILIAVMGVVPSFFLTAANILFFGFWKGTGISFAGEAMGAVIAFWLYRKGFKRSISSSLKKFPNAQRLIEADNKQAFLLILSLRLLPFVPSGLVTFAASIGRVSLLSFFIASSVGKLPALLLEAFSVYEVTRFEPLGKIILAVVAVAAVCFLANQGLAKQKTKP